MGYEKINDIFMLGEDILVAPVQKKGETMRTLNLPNGKWKYINGEVMEGNREVTVIASIDTLPIFEKLD